MHAKYVNERPALGLTGEWNPPLRTIKVGEYCDKPWKGEEELERHYSSFMERHPGFKTSTFSVMSLKVYEETRNAPVVVVVEFALAEPFHVDLKGTMQWRGDIAKDLFSHGGNCGNRDDESYRGVLLVNCPEALEGLTSLMERKFAKFKEDKLAYFKGVLEKTKGNADLVANYAYMKDIVEELEAL